MDDIHALHSAALAKVTLTIGEEEMPAPHPVACSTATGIAGVTVKYTIAKLYSSSSHRYTHDDPLVELAHSCLLSYGYSVNHLNTQYSQGTLATVWNKLSQMTQIRHKFREEYTVMVDGRDATGYNAAFDRESSQASGENADSGMGTITPKSWQIVNRVPNLTMDRVILARFLSCLTQAGREGNSGLGPRQQVLSEARIDLSREGKSSIR